MMLSMSLAFIQETKTETSFLFQIVPIIVFFFIIYFFLLRPQMKQQKEHRLLVDKRKKGDKIITNGGIWGEVDAVEDRTVRIKINDKSKIMVTRSAISGFQPGPVKEETKS